MKNSRLKSFTSRTATFSPALNFLIILILNLAVVTVDGRKTVLFCPKAFDQPYCKTKHSW